MSVFETEEKEGQTKTVVKKPYSCVTLCTGCDPICPAGAISHPTRKEFLKELRTLRKDPNFRLRK